MTRVNLEWEGDEALVRWLKKADSDVAPLMAEAMRTEAELIMTKAKKDTPVKTGRLRSTGHVKNPQKQGDVMEVTLAYGTDYALYVHEITRYAHPVGRSKFLEANVNAAAATLGNRVASRIARQIF